MRILYSNFFYMRSKLIYIWPDNLQSNALMCLDFQVEFKHEIVLRNWLLTYHEYATYDVETIFLWKFLQILFFYIFCRKTYKNIEGFMTITYFPCIQHVSWLYISVWYDLNYYYCMLALSVCVMMPLRSSQPMTKTNIGFVMKCEVHVSQITTRSLFEFISAFGTALEMKQNSYKRNLFMSSEMS